MTTLFKTASANVATGDITENARLAVQKIQDTLQGFDTNLVLYFSATNYDASVLAEEMYNAFPGITTIGCTSAGEGVDHKLCDGTVAAMAFSPAALKYAETALVLSDGNSVRQINREDVFADTAEATRYIARNTGQKLRDIDYREYVGFMMCDQITDFGEGVIERFGDLSNIMLVGGFAGDDFKFEGKIRVMYQGKAYGDGAAILALWKPANGFSLLKTEAVEILPISAVVTKADEKNNIVWELDGRKADEVYAELMGVPLETMGTFDFNNKPWASTVNGEAYVRCVMSKVDGGGLQFFARVREGTKITLTKMTDIIETTEKALDEKRREMGSISSIVQINCASRHHVMKSVGTLDEYAALVGDTPTITMSSYGEVYVGLIAMTSSMLLFK